MGLWLEHRDEKGTLKEALALAKPSSHLPLDKREWALRITFDDASV